MPLSALKSDEPQFFAPLMKMKGCAAPDIMKRTAMETGELQWGQVDFGFCLCLFVTSERLDRFWHSCNERLCLFGLFILVMWVLTIAAEGPKLWPKTHTVRMN